MTFGTAYAPLAERIQERLRRHQKYDFGRIWQLLRTARVDKPNRTGPYGYVAFLHGFAVAPLQVFFTSESSPPDPPARPFLRRAIDILAKGEIEKAGIAPRGVPSPALPDGSLEKALCDCRSEFAPNDQSRLRIVIVGGPKPLDPRVREEIFLAAREALVNALRHSGARWVEAEIEYLRRKLRVVIRDNGRGLNPKMLRQNSNRGLSEMRERASRVGGRIRLWSRPGNGTEVEISVPVSTAR